MHLKLFWRAPKKFCLSLKWKQKTSMNQCTKAVVAAAQYGNLELIVFCCILFLLHLAPAFYCNFTLFWFCQKQIKVAMAEAIEAKFKIGGQQRTPHVWFNYKPQFFTLNHYWKIDSFTCPIWIKGWFVERNRHKPL